MINVCRGEHCWPPLHPIDASSIVQSNCHTGLLLIQGSWTRPKEHPPSPTPSLGWVRPSNWLGASQQADHPSNTHDPRRQAPPKGVGGRAAGWRPWLLGARGGDGGRGGGAPGGSSGGRLLSIAGIAGGKGRVVVKLTPPTRSGVRLTKVRREGKPYLDVFFFFLDDTL